MLGIAGLVGATLILSALYLIMAVFAGKKLLYLHNVSPKLNTRKLFVMTCFNGGSDRKALGKLQGAV